MSTEMIAPKDREEHSLTDWPSISISTNAAVIHTGDKWRWVIAVHIGGVDDSGTKSRESEFFDFKKAATLDMLKRYEDVVAELFEELTE